MSVTIPLVALFAVGVYLCVRYMSLRTWHMILCLLLGFLLAATSAAPAITYFLHAFLQSGGHK